MCIRDRYKTGGNESRTCSRPLREASNSINDLVDQLIAHRSSEAVEIELAAGGQRPGQVLVADEHGAVAGERGVSEDVIGMAVGIDDIADRPVGAGANGGEQALALANAAARVDHRDRAFADDETDI